MNIEEEKQTALTIIGEEYEEASDPKKGAST